MERGLPSPRRRAPRSDATINRERVLVAALAEIRREGEKVPIASIATRAGVGVGTVYRHFPSRQHLLAALGHRSFDLVLAIARSAEEADGPALDGIRHFMEGALAHHTELFLPLHGAPGQNDEKTIELRGKVHGHVRRILDRARAEGAIHPDVSAHDIIIMGALLATPLPHVANWKTVARRQIRIYVAGLATLEPPELNDTSPPVAIAPARRVTASVMNPQKCSG